MTKTEKEKFIRIKPKYIKSKTGKTVGIYLDIKTCEAMVNTVKEFDKIKKRARQEHSLARKRKL